MGGVGESHAYKDDLPCSLLQAQSTHPDGNSKRSVVVSLECAAFDQGIEKIS